MASERLARQTPHPDVYTSVIRRSFQCVFLEAMKSCISAHPGNVISVVYFRVWSRNKKKAREGATVKLHN